MTQDGDTVLNNMVMTPAAIISGTGTGTARSRPLTVMPSRAIGVSRVLDSDFNFPDGPIAKDGINFKLAVEPGGTCRFGAYGADPNGSGEDVSYLERWWTGSDTPLAVTPAAAGGSGQKTGGINIRLTSALTARQAPSIVGIPAVGRPLTATTGTWSRSAGTEFSYTWMRGVTVVGTGTTYTPTAADVGSRLNVVVRALNESNVGQAASAQSDVVRWPSDANGRARALTGQAVRFAVKIVSARQKPVRGKVVVASRFAFADLTATC